VSQTSPAHPASRRPALVTFAAILLLMLGGFQLVLSITEFFQYAFGALPPMATANFNIILWLIDVILALVLFYGGYALLQGQAIGRLIALIVTVVTAIRWFFYLWYIPWAAALVIGICLLIIFALVRNEDYFTNG
jgi:hypothetical protein